MNAPTNTVALPHSGPPAQPPGAPVSLLSLRDVIPDENRLALLELWRSVTKRKWAILGLALAIAAVAGAIAFSLQPVYRSTATVLIEPDKAKAVSIEEVYGGIGSNREHYQTQVELLKSREVALRAIKKLQLWEDPEFDPRLPDDSLTGKAKKLLGISRPEVEWTDERLADSVLGRFRERLTVEPVRLSSLARVSFDSYTPALAAQVANTVVDSYVDADRDTRLSMTQKVNVWLQERSQSLRDTVLASERALQTYRDKQGIVSLSGSVQSMAGQQINELTQRLIEARARRTELESAYNDVKAITNGDYSSVPAVTRSSLVQDAMRQESAAALKLSELSQRYGPEHQRIAQAQGELATAREQLKQQVRVAVDGLDREYQAARSTERSLETALGSVRGSVQTINRKEFQLGVLQREVDANRQLYDLFMERAKETSNAADLQSSVARLVDPAAPSRWPVRPKKEQIILVALLLGLLLGAGISVLLDKLDNTIKSTEDAEARLKHPLLTALPLLKENTRRKTIDIVRAQPDSLYAEAVRTARTGVELSSVDSASRLLLITSALPGEGKTTFCANLALSHAQTKRTLLIDADMRRPQIGHNLKMPPNLPGLSNLVAGTAAVDQCVHSLDNSPLWVLTAGDMPPNPAELLLSRRFKDTLLALQRQFEVIVIDSPPVELVSDALIIAPQVTNTIFVTKAMSTPGPLARKTLFRLERAGAKILGVVLNQLDFTKAQKYYGSYSGYGAKAYGGYGKNYGYVVPKKGKAANTVPPPPVPKAA